MEYLNLCDIILKWNNKKELNSIIKKCEIEQNTCFSRIHVGSYFCSRFFLHFANRYIKIIQEISVQKNIRLSLVIPVFSQDLLDEGKEAIERILSAAGNRIDRIVVNDLGMLSWVSKKDYDIILGRLFANDPRDFRYDELRKRKEKPSLMCGGLSLLLSQFKRIRGFELDNIYEMEIDDTNMEVIIHYPYVYQSVGHICCYANLEVDVNDSFDANRSCSCDCIKNMISYGDNSNSIIRVGRTIVYRENSKIKSNNATMCYWPLSME